MNESETSIPTPYTPASEGCWFSDTRGIYIGEAVIREAVSKGLDTEVAGYTERDLVANPEDGNYLDHHYYEVTDAAEAYLNNFAPEGYWIGFNDGDFGMYKIDDEDTDEDTEDIDHAWPEDPDYCEEGAMCDLRPSAEVVVTPDIEVLNAEGHDATAD